MMVPSSMRLVLPDSDPTVLANWQAKYLDDPPGPTLPIAPEIATLLLELCGLVGGTPSWWAQRLLILHLQGRARLEQIQPLSLNRPRLLKAGSLLDAVKLQVALHQDLTELANHHGCSAADMTHAALQVQLNGSVPPGQSNLGDGQWQSDDVTVKIWLPQSLDAMVGGLATIYRCSSSDVIRNFLLAHLVGRLGYERAIANGLWKPTRREAELPELMFSKKQWDGAAAPVPRTAFINAHGKSTEAFKLWCPTPMKARLETRATAAGKRTSEYTRQVLVNALLGHLPQPPNSQV